MLALVFTHIFTTQWLVLGFVSTLLLAASEFGFRFGLRLYRAKDEARKGQIGGIQGAMLGLLGLLLGFTFAMAVGRYEYGGHWFSPRPMPLARPFSERRFS